jgi:alpha-mannosidase
MNNLQKSSVTAFLLILPLFLQAQQAYFVDGFHGGIWGHYPLNYTTYIVNQLKIHPDWKINLEIEPETWDRESLSDPESFKALQAYLLDNSSGTRAEYVNPTYGQPYLFNISGESMIRQFAYGIKKLNSHFPGLIYTTYSSEEPCFTSALPKVLIGLGYKYASLKNPNTCWGGYTRAFGQGLVNWISSDGSSIITSPRYAIEGLKPGSTWETIASNNSDEYITAALKDGINMPVGMCLQDAGWRMGPWLKGQHYQPTAYTTWRYYFENAAGKEKVTDWKFNQEDILTSLVWGSQVLQKIAQQVRMVENKIVQSEKIATINRIDRQLAYPENAFDTGWRKLMLSQHHDCWIVPYNGSNGDTWADKVKAWTSATNAICDSITYENASNLAGLNNAYLKVYNTNGKPRFDWVKYTLPTGIAKGIQVLNAQNKEVPSQLLQAEHVVIFKAAVPAFGYAVYKIKTVQKPEHKPSGNVSILSNGDCILESDMYKIHFSKTNGGTIQSLVAKFAANKEFVDGHSPRKFNELRGNFYKKGGFLSSIQNPAKISVLESGPFQSSIKIEGLIAGSPFSQVVTLRNGERKIHMRLNINWQLNERVGEYEETHYQSGSLRKAFYDDRFKLLTQFPLALKNQQVYKNAPFDVMQSHLEDTYFNSWDSIKNNIILDWVDVTSGDKKYGLAVFTDHTTSYTHGANAPLGLTMLYSGQGLWGRDYKVEGPTEINYHLLPHRGTWQKAGLEEERVRISEPLVAVPVQLLPRTSPMSYVELLSPHWVISACYMEGKDIYMRIYNTGSNQSVGKVKVSFKLLQAALVDLKSRKISDIPLKSLGANQSELELKLAPFGFKTLKISKF